MLVQERISSPKDVQPTATAALVAVCCVHMLTRGGKDSWWPIATVLSALLLACDEAPLAPPPLEDLSVLQVSVRLNRSSLRPGDTLRITVIATNPTDRTLRFELPACARFFTFEVERISDAPNEADNTTSVGRFDIIGEPGTRQPVLDHVVCGLFPAQREPEPHLFEFAPGQSKKAEFGWTAQIQRSRSLPPGRYEVIGALGAGGPRSGPVPVQVLSILTLTLDIDPLIPGVGDSVTITATLKNEDDQAVMVPDLFSCRFGVWARRADSNVAFLTGCPVTETLIRLRPGQQRERTVSWEVLEPGVYELFAQHIVGAVQPDLSTTVTVRVK